MTTIRQSSSCPTPPPYTQSSTIRINTTVLVRDSISNIHIRLISLPLARAPRKTAPSLSTQAHLPAFPTYGIVPRAPRTTLFPRNSAHHERSPSSGAGRSRQKVPKVDPAVGGNALPVIGLVSPSTGEGILCGAFLSGKALSPRHRISDQRTTRRPH